MVLTPLRVIADQRGAVLHMLRADDPEFVGFGECYFSEVLPGVVKGWKRHLRQTQVFAVPWGRMRIVLYDDRDGSPSRGLVQVFDLGRPDAYRRLRIPPRLWYSFSSVGTMPSLLANCPDLPHDPTESETRSLLDPAIPYTWASASAEQST